MSRNQTPFTPELAEYLFTVTNREPEALKRERLSTEDHPQAGMQSSPEQCQFLQVVARLVGAKKVLEVGVFLGYSSSWVALALPPGGKIVACDLSEEYTATARKTWRAAGVEDRIELHLGPALETLDRLIAEGHAGTFDMAFIDADKTNYSNYFDRAVQLVRQGGAIVADNVFWHGNPIDSNAHDADTEGIRAFNLKVHADPRVAITMVPLGDGLTVACKL
ncbi:MAG TPA: class I SAM-dependent methyltransferase [Bryobacteraceae bacterium]|nr:class I SAM-dependent methyltransferase [Bryobacteraceae bacterium]